LDLDLLSPSLFFVFADNYQGLITTLCHEGTKHFLYFSLRAFEKLRAFVAF